MDDHWPRIGILVLNHNGRHWLRSIFSSLLDQNYSNKRIFLVDNASEDGSIETTLAEYREVTIISLPQNLGYCMAYNLAMKQAFADQCDWVIWANNDVKLEAGCLSAMVEVAQSDARIGVAGPAFLSWEKDEPNYYILGNYPQAIPAMENRSKVPMDVEWVEGSFLMVSRRCYESVGPLDPYLFLYWEEADFCRRARFQDWRVVLVPAALARHYGGGSSEAEPANQKIAKHLQTRNFYIYKLSNPFQGFLRNCADALHLFLVNIKGALCSEPKRAWFHLRVFGGLIWDFRLVYAKWNRDRAGKHPNPLSEDLAPPILDILPRENPGVMSAVDRLFNSNPANKEIL
jgi:GT2 family glycosyltransferase